MLLFASHYSTSTRVVGKWVVGSGMQGEVLVGERPDTNKQTNETQRERNKIKHSTARRRRQEDSINNKDEESEEVERRKREVEEEEGSMRSIIPTPTPRSRRHRMFTRERIPRLTSRMYRPSSSSPNPSTDAIRTHPSITPTTHTSIRRRRRRAKRVGRRCTHRRWYTKIPPSRSCRRGSGRCGRSV